MYINILYINPIFQTPFQDDFSALQFFSGNVRKKIKPLTSQLQSINESKLGRVASSSTSSQR